VGVLCIYGPFVLLSAGLFASRARSSTAIRSRFPWLSLVSATWGVVFFLCICAQQIVGEARFPSWVALWSSHLIPPIYAFPYMLRTWSLFCAYLRQRHVASLDHSAAGWFSARLAPSILHRRRWLAGPKFIGIVWAAVTAVHVLSIIAFNVARPCYRGNGGTCVFFDEIWLFLPMLGVYCVAMLLGLRLLWEVKEDYHIRLELVTCFFSWGVFAGAYFVLRLLNAFPRINAAFPASWIMALWPFSTYVITIAAPALWFLPIFCTTAIKMRTEAHRRHTVMQTRKKAQQQQQEQQPITVVVVPTPTTSSSSSSQEVPPPEQPTPLVD
jgi:hypothetical protein